MGGNIFPEARRLSAEEYNQEIELVQDYLLSRHNLITQTIPYYRHKETFGDLDLLLTKPKYELDIPYSIKHSHGLSFLWAEKLQVDLIYTIPELFDSNLHYFSYNDLHNLMGKVAKNIRCKLGNHGLYFSFANPWSGAVKEVFLTRNWEDIYTFLGYDYSQYVKGFDTLEDIFTFIINGKYFQAGKFELNNLKHRDRVRDKKRQTYKEFLLYLESNNVPKNVEYRSYKDCVSLAESHFTDIDISQAILDSIYKECDAHYYKQKFNGDIVRGLTGLQDRQLGKFMQSFKSTYTKHDILCRGHLSVSQLILDHYNNEFATTSN